MYDINRSNLLSTETMKMYLYDISALGALRKKEAQNKEVLLLSKSTLQEKMKNDNLNLRTVFNESPYSPVHVPSFSTFIMYVLCTLFCAIFWKFFFNFCDVTIPTKYVVSFVVIMMVVSFLVYRSNVRNAEYENYKRERNKAMALDAFNVQKRELCDHISISQKNLAEINFSLTQSEKISVCAEQQLTRLYQQELLHPNYQDPQICGILFQLFDTGRVHNLTEAMNLYEDLCWKTEMSSLLQSLVARVDDLISITSSIEYYSRCTLDNQKETHRLLNGMSMQMSQISENQEAIRVNTEVLRSNSEVMRTLQEWDHFRKG